MQTEHKHPNGLDADLETRYDIDEELEERAAIMEYDGGLSREEAEREAGIKWNFHS